MKKTKLLFMALGLMLLTACSSSSAEQKETVNYSVNIDGERTYISDDDKDVINVKETALGYLDKYVNKDHKKEGNMEILPYLADELRTSYEQSNVVAANQQAIRNYELVESLEGYDIAYVQMYSLYGQPAAELFVTYTAKMETATDDYLASLGMKPGTRYKRTLTLQLVKVEEGWKIKTTSLGAREVIG